MTQLNLTEQQAYDKVADNATHLLEQAFAVVEGSFYNLRDEALNAEQLFDMRIRLQDATDTINEACRYIEQLQRRAESECVE